MTSAIVPVVMGILQEGGGEVGTAMHSEVVVCSSKRRNIELFQIIGE